MKKALSNIACGDKFFTQGEVYEDKDVAHLDPNDFETVSVDEVEEKPKSMTTESLKPKKAVKKVK